MKYPPTVLVAHPDQYTAEELTAVLQEYGLNALPVTSAVDSIEHVENLYFDLALVSNQMPSALPELLFQSHRGIWLEIIVLKIPRQGCVVDTSDFVLAVREAISDSRIMSHQMEEVLYSACYGEAAEPRTTLLAEWAEGEWAKFEGLERMFAESRSD